MKREEPFGCGNFSVVGAVKGKPGLFGHAALFCKSYLDQIGDGGSIALWYPRFDIRFNGMPHAWKFVFDRLVGIFMVRIICADWFSKHN
jgi:hypothetical protein